MIKTAFKNNEEFTRIEKERLKTLEEEIGKCEICKKYKRNPSIPVVGLPLAKNFNEVLTVDLGQLEGSLFLVMLDWATGYCQAKWIKNKKPNEIIEGILEKWISYFGAPSKILSDGGREFQNDDFLEFSEKFGIELLSTASESPWGNGKCEKAVGILKEGLEKLKEENIRNKEYALTWIVSAKNEIITNSGFSANQKVFSTYNRSQERLEMNPAELEELTENEKLKEILETQQKVRESFRSTECRNRIKRALKAKIRTHKLEEAVLGDKVFYKRKNEKKWRGPGKVIGVEGKTVKTVKHGGLFREVHKIHV